MSYYAMIYSPEGEPFEVPHDRAAELVLNHGWTRQIVHKEPVKAERAQPVRQIVTSVVPAKADALPTPDDKPH